MTILYYAVGAIVAGWVVWRLLGYGKGSGDRRNDGGDWFRCKLVIWQRRR